MSNGNESYWRGRVDERLENIEKDIDEIKTDVKAIRKNGNGCNHSQATKWHKNPAVTAPGGAAAIIAIVELIRQLTM